MKNYDLIVATSPHFHNGNSVQKTMLDVIIALVPAVIASVVIFGTKSIALIATCVITAVVTESLYDLCTKKKNTVSDLSAVLTGLLLALNLGTEVAIWEAVVGTVFAIAFVKCLFGGLGKNFANPAITGRVFMIMAFGSVATFKSPAMAELVSSATPLALIAQNKLDEVPSIMNLLLGVHGGTIGETCIIALVLGWIYLSVRKVIKWYVPAAFICTVFVLFLVVAGPQVALLEVLSGGLFLGAIFMATDYVTTPITVSGKVVFCICCGIITFVIRKFCSLPEGVSFSILIMNIFTPYIEKLTHNIPLGGPSNGK